MENSSGLKAVILAAGEGTRLRPYTLDRPKCLVEVDGKSLLDRQLAVLAMEAVNPVIVIGGYRAEMLKRPGIELRTNPRYAETNMVWTLFCAEDDLEGDVLLCYGDIVYSREILQAVLNPGPTLQWRSTSTGNPTGARATKIRWPTPKP